MFGLSPSANIQSSSTLPIVSTQQVHICLVVSLGCFFSIRLQNPFLGGAVQLTYSESQKRSKTELFRISTLETLGNCRNPSNSDFVHAEMAVQVMPPARGLPKSGSLHALGSVKRTT